MVSEVGGPSSGLIKSLDQKSANTDKSMAVASAEIGTNRAADVVTLTDLAARLQQLVRSVAEVPVVDQQKVETFRDAVANGSYMLDASAVADKLTTSGALVAMANSAT